MTGTATQLAEELESLDPPLLSDDAVKRHSQHPGGSLTTCQPMLLQVSLLQLGPG
jgi:hypothetical protein